MAELSVGYTAGLIAAGIVIAQLWLPTTISFLLAGVLRDEETAASLTVASKILQSSHWTTLLRTDAARGHAVRTPIYLASLAIPFATVLTAVAGVVTPLGLYEETVLGGREVGNFSYVGDTSAFFYGTSPRDGYNFSRVCTYRREYAPCPLTNDTLVFSRNSTTANWNYPQGLTTDIPPALRDMYSSGTHGIGTTVSNFFDIGWRQLTIKIDSFGVLNNGSSEYSVSMFRHLDSVALDDSIMLVEGLVVDTRTGGVGFRNHTVPQPPDRNVTWQEDILFVEPVTVCVDTNLTFDFTASGRNFSSTSNGPPDYRVTDRGGFVNLNLTYPYYDRDDPQANPDLWGRAYKAAMMHNAYAMMYLNVTNPGDASAGVKAFQYLNSTMGKTFPLDVGSGVDYRAARFTSEYGTHFFPNRYSNDKPKYPNPYNVTMSEWFSSIPIICSGAGSGDTANITNIFVACGLVNGPPRRVDPGPQSIFEHGSQWTTPLYSCATAVRATIKTVDFSTNPSAQFPPPSSDPSRGLAALLQVTNISDKSYASPSAHPIWGVEKTGRNLSDIRPVWGLVSPAYLSPDGNNSNYPNLISVVRQPWLYLPGLANDHLRGDAPSFYPSAEYAAGRDNLPGADFPFAAANTIFQSGGVGRGISDEAWPFDLAGRSDMAVFTRWQRLCESGGEGAARMINLLWTDLAASAVVGTKGISTGTAQGEGGGREERGGDTPPNIITIHIRPAVRRTRYHFAYGIPAFVLLAVLLALTAGSVCAWLARVSSLDRVRRRIHQLSVGRIFTIVLYPGESDFGMSPKQWSLLSAGKTVRFADGEEHGVGGGGAGVAGEEEEGQDMIHTSGTGFADGGGSEGKGEVGDVKEVPVLQVPDGAQRGGYIALDPDRYEWR
ncbi:hypothetical protein N658DRAFT_459157 [Parathielavia hyrcaniae]|uniref:Uncharacterized protein n=1 Tax=Parathielavia hyrcaniae TaxID=113614 RepID=A0AAN6PR36_9PEZI|nr:hypothetical protein N658DRAFT_459157 [Parathielavia hyrcaniae]